MHPSSWDRFRTGQALQGRLLRALVEPSGPGATLAAGSRIGPWRIVELIGSGGMSHVYRAERADSAFVQEVALKLVRGDPELTARLRHERRVVATLRHPHIVNLIDGGETDAGELWFAMGLVEGEAIDDYARRQQLDWRACLRLVEAVCAALEYAHGRALIHRDIKPANILVDSQGHPRLLDFGIALTDDGGERAADHVLTPGFASPEQLAGQPVAVTSDIYQLGLVLRVLMSPEQTRRMPAGARKDLEKLLARATAQEPQERHSTAAELRQDLANLLARRPLDKDRHSARLRWTHFFERHRAAIWVAFAAACVLGGNLAVSALRLRTERNQAVTEAVRANAVSDFLVETLTQANPYAAQKGDVSVLEAMDHAAATLDGRPGVSADLRRALRTAIGTIYSNLDEPARCLDLLGSRLAAGDLADASAQIRARTLILHSECHLALDQREPAWSLLEQALTALAGADGQEATRLRAFVLIDQGQLLSLNGRLEEANDLLEQGRELAIRSVSTEQEYRANRFLGYNLQSAGDNVAAIAAFQRALELARSSLGPSHRSTLTTAGNLAISYARLERWQEAESTLQDALAAAQAIRDREGAPEIVIAQLRDSYANALWLQGRFDECLVQARESLEIYQRLAPKQSSQGFNPSWRIATCAYQAGQLELAQEYAELAHRYAGYGVPVGIINALRMRAAIAARRDRLDAAREFLAQAEDAFAQTEVANPNVRTALLLTHALLAARNGDASAARARIAEADARVQPPGKYEGWLRQERGEVLAMLEAKP